MFWLEMQDVFRKIFAFFENFLKNVRLFLLLFFMFFVFTRKNICFRQKQKSHTEATAVNLDGYKYTV